MIKYNSLEVKSPLKEYEHNVLGIYNWRNLGHLTDYFELIYNISRHGDNQSILEFGVHKGNSLVASAVFSRSLDFSPEIIGYDTWEGFPKSSIEPIDEQQGWARFKDLKIQNDDFFKARDQLLEYTAIGKNTEINKLNARNVSASEDFSHTSEKLVNRKLSALSVENMVELCKGDFSDKNFVLAHLPQKPIALVLIDADLYKSYTAIFEALWPIVPSGCIFFLDEYFSLTFPGARLATDDFLSALRPDAYQLRKVSDIGDFERYILIKK